MGYRALLAVASTGSISRAARREGLSRAALTRALDSLTEEAGTPLVTTSRQGATLTRAGARLAEPAPGIVQLSAELLTRFEVPADAPGHFRIVASPGLAPPITARITTLAARALAGSRFDVLVSDAPLDLLRESADLAVVFGPEIPEGPWKTAALVRLEEGLYATPKWLHRHGTPQSLDDLASHRLLYNQRAGTPASALPLNDGSVAQVQPWMVANDPWLIQRTTERGSGIGFFPTGPLPPRDDDPPRLVRVLPDLVGRRCTIQLVFADASVPRLRWRSLADLARLVFKGL